MGDATVLTELLRRLHRVFPHVPWLIVGKEISIEDVEASLDKLADRFLEHPEMVFVVTNMSYREAPHLTPLRGRGRSRAQVDDGARGHHGFRLSRQI